MVQCCAAVWKFQRPRPQSTTSQVQLPANGRLGPNDFARLMCVSTLLLSVYSSRTEAKRCPSLPYRWQVSLAVSAFGTLSLERSRPSTQPRQDDRNLSLCFRHTGSDPRPALPLRQFQAEIRLSAVGSGCDRSGSLSDRGQNSLQLDPYLRHVRLRPRVCQPGCCPWIRSAISADPLGSQGCGERFRKRAAEVPQRCSSCYTVLGQRNRKGPAENYAHSGPLGE